MTSSADRVEGLVAEYVEGRVDRRQFFRRAAGLGIALPAASALFAAAAETAAGAGDAAPAGKLRIRMLNDIANLDPPFYPTLDDSNGSVAINEGLVTYKPGTFQVLHQPAETVT